MDLVRDLLDSEIVDRNGREMGRVDSVILEIRDGAPPRVAAIGLGLAVLAARVGSSVGRLAGALEHAFGVGDGVPLRIAMSAVLSIHDHVTVDLAIGETAAGAVEQRLRGWLGSIPGAS